MLTKHMSQHVGMTKCAGVNGLYLAWRGGIKARRVDGLRMTWVPICNFSNSTFLEAALASVELL